MVASAITLLFITSHSQPASAYFRRHAAPAGADYLGLLKNHVIWNKLPVTIYFVRDEEYSPSRERAARAGFDLWEQATDGYVTYEVVDSPKRAQITVSFDPDTNDGHTTTSFTSRRIVSARIVIGAERENESDLECTSAHEFGHALGLAGHSSVPRDLMYPAHYMGRSWSLTRRDLNTLARVYHVDPDIAANWTPLSR